MKITNKITSFTQLKVWQKSHQLTLDIYKTCKDFPKEEAYGLTSQIKRAALSITSNIAEGFGRRSLKEKVQFYFTSKGSLTELQNQLLLAKDLHYINKQKFKKIANNSVEIAKMLNSMISKTKKMKTKK